MADEVLGFCGLSKCHGLLSCLGIGCLFDSFLFWIGIWNIVDGSVFGEWGDWLWFRLFVGLGVDWR
jgi:hypothetical protein